MAEIRPAGWRNIWIYTAVVLVAGNIGGASFTPEGGLGALVFILAPVLTALALRTFGGDGWADAGFGLGRSGWAYLFALIYLPLLFAIALFTGMAFGVTGVLAAPPNLMQSLLASAALFGVYGVLEEIGWRGYMEPRLAALGLAPLRRHLFVGVVWALWHVGYILAQPGYSALPPVLFWPIFLIAVLAMAVVHGWLRAKTGSIWPNVILHVAGNVAAAQLIAQTQVAPGADLLFSPRSEGLLVLVLLIATGAVLMRRPDATR